MGKANFSEDFKRDAVVNKSPGNEPVRRSVHTI